MSLPSHTRGGSRMRESRTYGSVRGACDETHVPTATGVIRAAAKQDGLGIVTKVLYVEHNDDNLYMLKTRLELRGGFEVLAAEDSEKGCRLAATEHPDVILMDLEMPDDDRWEAVRRLKNDPQTQDIPIMACPRTRWRASARRPSRPCRSRAHLPGRDEMRSRRCSATVQSRQHAARFRSEG